MARPSHVTQPNKASQTLIAFASSYSALITYLLLPNTDCTVTVFGVCGNSTVILPSLHEEIVAVIDLVRERRPVISV